MYDTKIISLPSRALGAIGIQIITFSISTSKGILTKRGAIVLPMKVVSDSPLGRRMEQGSIMMNLW